MATRSDNVRSFLEYLVKKSFLEEKDVGDFTETLLINGFNGDQSFNHFISLLYSYQSHGELSPEAVENLKGLSKELGLWHRKPQAKYYLITIDSHTSSDRFECVARLTKRQAGLLGRFAGHSTAWDCCGTNRCLMCVLHPTINSITPIKASVEINRKVIDKLLDYFKDE